MAACHSRAPLDAKVPHLFKAGLKRFGFAPPQAHGEAVGLLAEGYPQLRPDIENARTKIAVIPKNQCKRFVMICAKSNRV
jgi:hypothetical protein